MFSSADIEHTVKASSLNGRTHATHKHPVEPATNFVSYLTHYINLIHSQSKLYLDMALTIFFRSVSAATCMGVEPCRWSGGQL